jgi:hypothetical protein
MLLLLDEYGQTQRRTIGFKSVEYVFENSDGPALLSGWVYSPERPISGGDFHASKVRARIKG